MCHRAVALTSNVTHAYATGLRNIAFRNVTQRINEEALYCGVIKPHYALVTPMEKCVWCTPGSDPYMGKMLAKIAKSLLTPWYQNTLSMEGQRSL